MKQEERAAKKDQKGRPKLMNYSSMMSLKQVRDRIIELALFILLFKYLPLSIWLKVAVVGLVFALITLVRTRQIKPAVKTFIMMVIVLVIMIELFRWAGKYGIWAIIGAVMLVAAWKLYRQWPSYMAGLRRIETLLFGRPLDKKHWKAGEFKNRPRRKLVWKKKKKEKKKNKMLEQKRNLLQKEFM